MGGTAGLSGMMYGAEVSGIADSMLEKQRAAIAKASSAPGAGKNVATSLWLHDVAMKRRPLGGACNKSLIQQVINLINKCD